MTLRTLLCTFVALGAMAAAADDPVVDVTGGRIRGKIASDGGAAFKGIPFAKPPVGDLRWREPEAPAPWTNIRDAYEFMPACVQLSEGWNADMVPTSSEDCLYLNVATPLWPPKQKLAVMFWIHGGSNMAGAGEAPAFDERALVRHGIVWVTVNYRLGALGFMAHPDLVKESNHGSSGNYGLLDQIAALRWVRDNIAKFGGDPDNVTIAGESAGAWDVSLLMTSPLAKGLFNKAIQESGSIAAFKGALPPARAQELGQKVAAQLNAPEENAIAFLRKVPGVEIMKAGVAARGKDQTGLEASVDGWVLPERPEKVYAEGRALHIPVITGTNAQEIVQPMGSAKIAEGIKEAYGAALAERAIPMYAKTDALYGLPGSQWLTDLVFRCPSVTQAVWHAKTESPVYVYEFEQPAPGKQQSVHAGELAFVFGTWDKKNPPTAADQKIAEQVQSYWANFTRTGSPNGEGLPAWLGFNAKTQDYMAFTADGAAAKSGLRRPYCEVFTQAEDAIAAK